MPKGLRPFELESSVLLPQHGISRLTSQMVKQNLLSRLTCADDKRGFRLIPTETGLQLRQRMWAVYQPVIKRFFGEQLSVDEIRTLMPLLNRSG